ncbi:hypothetical protein H0X48_01925 [Candidatus Dependentiae bacterium]|nr:hypothetical protein [Candidatus Dependentiae bacterium]
MSYVSLCNYGLLLIVGFTYTSLTTAFISTQNSALRCEDISEVIDSYLLNDDNDTEFIEKFFTQEEKNTITSVNLAQALYMSVATVTLIKPQTKSLQPDSLVIQGPQEVDNGPAAYIITFTPNRAYTNKSITITDFLPEYLQLLEAHSDAFKLEAIQVTDNQRRLIFRNICSLEPDQPTTITLRVKARTTNNLMFSQYAQAYFEDSSSARATMSNIQVSTYKRHSPDNHQTRQIQKLS